MLKLFFIFALTLASIPTLACTSAIGQDAPSADAIVQRSIEAAGGLENYRKIKSLKLDGKLKMPSLAIDGLFSLAYQEPDKIQIKIEIGGGTAVITQGRNGDIGWETSTVSPNRKIEGAELDEMLEAGNMYGIFELDEIYSEMSYVGKESINGIECNVVAAVRSSNDQEEKLYFAVDTGLPVRTVGTRTTEAGKQKVITDYLQYKEIEGIQFAVEIRNELPQLKIVQEISFSEVLVNPEIDPNTFAIPDEFKPATEATDAATTE